MNKFLRYLTIIVLIFFEVYAGVRLLTFPEDFTNSVIIFFGIIMLIIGIISLVNALRAKKFGLPYRLSLAGAIFDLILGVVCVAFSNTVLGFFPVLVRIYGVIMVISGIHKIRNYALLKDMGIHRSWLVIVSAVLNIILGIIVFMNPWTTTVLGWTWTGYFLIFEGVFDLFTFIFSFFF